MTPSPLPAFALSLAALLIPASAGITFGPVHGKPGESVRLITHSETHGGTIEKTLDGKTSRGSIEIIRDRELIWTFRQPAEDGTLRGMVRVPKTTAATKTTIDRKTENLNDVSPLTGKMFAMTKPPKGEWSFQLDGSVPLSETRAEIDSMKVYLKRDWYPTHEVQLGDSWEFDPIWIKMIIERDLDKAQTIGTMSLRQIRRSTSTQTAVIDIAIHSSGGDFHRDGTEVNATVELSGQVIVNLGTMLDESLTLKGTVTTTTDRVSESSKIKLPISLVATKSFIKDTALP